MNTNVRPETLPCGLILRVTPIEQAFARFVAKARLQGHERTRTQAQSLGSRSANWKAECFGALCEIALYTALEREGYRPEYTLLTEGKPPVGPDFRLNGIGFEVKAVLPQKRFVCINAEQAQRRADSPGFYLVGQFLSPSCLRLFAPVAFHAASRWHKMKNGHSPYYSVAIHTLQSLRTWADLPGVEEPGGNNQVA